MTSAKSLWLAGGLAAAVLAILPATGSGEGLQIPPNQHLKIANRSTDAVTVRVLHSDGSLQKQETVKPGDTHRFIFEWCDTCCGHDKQRTFEVKTGSTLRATGGLYMATKKVVVSSQGNTSCDVNNQMTLKDENADDRLLFTKSYENGHRTAIVTVTGSTD